MIAEAFEDQAAKKIMVSRLSDYAPLEEDGPFDALLASRLDFTVRVVDIPPVSESEVENLLRFKLRSVYPGNPADTELDYTVVGEGKKKRALLFICRRATLERYRKAAGQKPILLPWSLTRGLVGKRTDAVVWFVHRDWVEVSVSIGGLPISATVHPRARGSDFDLCAAAGMLPEDVRSLQCIVVCPADEVESIKSRIPEADAPRTRYVTFNQLTERGAPALFTAKKQRRALLSPAARLGILGAAVVLLTAVLFIKLITSAEAKYTQLVQLHASLEAENRRIVSIQGEVKSMSDQLAALQARESPNAYHFLSEIAAVFGSAARVRSFTLSAASFQVDAVGTGPLKLMEGFKNHPLFTDVKLAQVTPDAATGTERFSISGVYHAH